MVKIILEEVFCRLQIEKLLLISLGKLFVDNINKIGLKTLPWETPLMTDSQSDDAELTRILSSVRQEIFYPK